MSKILLIAFAALASYIGYTSYNNTSTMNGLIEEMNNIIEKDYKLKELEIGEFKKILVFKILPFYSKVYQIEGLGIYSVLTLNVGIMQMLTINVNPYEKDIPQLTIEFTVSLQTRKIYIEIYELMVDKENEKYKNYIKKVEEIKNKYSNLKDFSSKESWHNKYLPVFIRKSGTPKDDKTILYLFKEVVLTYFEYAKEAPALSEDDKKKKYEAIKEFSDQLAEKGGVAIDNFKKTLGEEKTKEFLGKAFYGYLQVS